MQRKAKASPPELKAYINKCIDLLEECSAPKQNCSKAQYKEY